MKKWLLLIGALAAVGFLSRLPHPARDISELKPVQAVYLHKDGGNLCIETDTGDVGTGRNLPEAARDLSANADGEIFLDTAEFLILGREITIDPTFYQYLRPGCRVCYADEQPDLAAAVKYLSAHPPEITLAHLRPESILQ